MVSPQLDLTPELLTQAKVTDLRQRGIKLVERLYGPRIRYHVDRRQIQLDGEPIPAELFYLVLHRDHGLRMPKRLAKEILVSVAQTHPFSPHAPVAATDPYIPRESLQPIPMAPAMGIPSGLNSWMIQLREIMQRKWIG